VGEPEHLLVRASHDGRLWCLRQSLGGDRGKESDTPGIYTNRYKHAQKQAVENLSQPNRPWMNAEDAVIERLLTLTRRLKKFKALLR
jgi:hypothetical protein